MRSVTPTHPCYIALVALKRHYSPASFGIAIVIQVEFLFFIKKATDVSQDVGRKSPDLEVVT